MEIKQPETELEAYEQVMASAPMSKRDILKDCRAMTRHIDKMRLFLRDDVSTLPHDQIFRLIKNHIDISAKMLGRCGREILERHGVNIEETEKVVNGKQD